MWGKWVFALLSAVAFNLNAFAITPLFVGSNDLEMSLTAPFQELHQHRVSPWDPALSGAEYTVQGVLTFVNSSGATVILRPIVSMRGNSSQAERECPFPKLKLKFTAAEVSGTIFEGNATVGIATHCGDIGGTSPLGRPWNGMSPHREIVAYKTLEVLGVPSLLTRHAWFNYVEASTGQPIGGRKQAFFLENTKSAATRFGMIEHEQISREFESVEESPGVTELHAARIYFAEALIANWDWKLKVKKAPMAEGDNIHDIFWNMKAFIDGNDNWLIIPYDFDLAQIVSNRFTRNLRIDQIPLIFPKNIRQQVVREFAPKEAEVMQLTDRLTYDPDGQTQMRNHFRWYFQNLRSLEL